MSFSTTNLFGGIVFGSIGFAAFIYGKKQANFKPMVIGIGLMAFPYFVSNTVFLWTIGLVLTLVLFLFRD